MLCVSARAADAEAPGPSALPPRPPDTRPSAVGEKGDPERHYLLARRQTPLACPARAARKAKTPGAPTCLPSSPSRPGTAPLEGPRVRR